MRPPTLTLSAVLLVSLLAAGCRNADRRAFESRCDASLRQRVEALGRAGADDSLDVLGRADGALDAARRARLAAAGASLREVSQALFVIRVRAGAVPRVAALDFVRSLQLAQVRSPLTP